MIARLDVPRAQGLPHGRHDGWYETALALINQRVTREALLMAYSDTFLIAGSAVLACVAGAVAIAIHKGMGISAILPLISRSEK